ncbi:MAG TPA: hypothetical protein VFV37_08595 [Luteibaculaceae bacterium]|jgi:hypothetical protein|nr:hypothetical protein [Luteibaculaceae bacterium]
MHDIEPFYRWRDEYIASEDPQSPFYGRTHSEFEFTHAIYNYLIHPQWDDVGCPTLFLKVIYADYVDGFAVIELIGEWNDLLHNDIMTLKRDYLEPMMGEGLHKFILLGENVLNFHYSDDSYYEEWYEELSDQGGWVALLNFREHVLSEMSAAGLDYYFVQGGKLEAIEWRTYKPDVFCRKVEQYVQKWIGA